MEKETHKMTDDELLAELHKPIGVGEMGCKTPNGALIFGSPCYVCKYILKIID